MLRELIHCKQDIKVIYAKLQVHIRRWLVVNRCVRGGAVPALCHFVARAKKFPPSLHTLGQYAATLH